MWEFWRSNALSKSKSTSPRKGALPVLEDGVNRTDSLKKLQLCGSVNFKDLNLNLSDAEDEEEAHVDSQRQPSNLSILAPKRGPEKNKLIIIMVGLPGRGKTFLCNKLKCYLNWLGHHTKHFNVGNYRRKQKGDDEVQDASFFDAHNPAGLEARNKALGEALDDLHTYLLSDEGQVAIFDATNTTEERRQLLIKHFHGRWQYLFIESICTDDNVLQQNYEYKMRYSPDYQGVDTQAAIQDFKARIRKYEEVYEPISSRNLHYIKLIDMVTGRGHMDVNRISGYIPGKIVFFLMQVCRAGTGQFRKIWLTRHGESVFNLEGKIGGDSNLSFSGQQYAEKLPEELINRLPLTFDDQLTMPVSVWTSTLKRTIQTAELLPFPKLRWKALDEIHAGICDGLTYAEIKSRWPEEYKARSEDKLRYRYPSGESYMDLVQRLEPVIIEMERERESICIVAHQAVLRVIYGYFMAVPLAQIPSLEIPLHTLIELQPRPDGTMLVEKFPTNISRGRSQPGSPTTMPPPTTPFNPPVNLPLGSSPEEWNNLRQAKEAAMHKRGMTVA